MSETTTKAWGAWLSISKALSWPSQYVTRWSFSIALRRPAPQYEIGQPAPYPDFFRSGLSDRPDHWPFYAKHLTPDGIEGFWTEQESGLRELRTIPTEILSNYRTKFIHHFPMLGFDTVTYSPYAFVFLELTRLNHMRVLFRRLDQKWFNRKSLSQEGQLNVLRVIAQKTLRVGEFNGSAFHLMQILYRDRFISHPDRDALSDYYTLLLKSLAETGDLSDSKGRFNITPRGIRTLGQLEEEHQRHDDNLRQQRAMVWVTLLLAMLALAQIYATIYGPR